MRINRIAAWAIVGTCLTLASIYTTADRTLKRESPTRTLLESQGYTDVCITGWDWIAADAIWRPSTGFMATTRDGIRCSGAVVVDSDGVTRVRFH
jgi:hypothetical protein